MIVGLLAAILLTQHPAREITLRRGDVIEGPHSWRYWDYEDTSLDSANPESPRGGEATLIGGQGQVILIRFGDLDRALAGARHVVSARLRLHEVSGDAPKLVSVSRLLSSWREGPFATMNDAIQRMTEESTPGKKPGSATPPMSATWRDRLTGLENGAWQQPGARGPEDARLLEGVQIRPDGKDFVIDGLAQAVQSMADHPDLNFGFALQFSNDVEFQSGKAQDGRPSLELEVDSQQPNSTSGLSPDLSVVRIELPSAPSSRTYLAHVKNVGTAPSGGFSATWSINGRQGVAEDHNEVLPPQSELVLKYQAPPNAITIGLHIDPKGPDASHANDGLTIATGARALTFKLDPGLPPVLPASSTIGGSTAVEDWIQRQVEIFNDTYLTQSRFSFSPGGVKTRISVGSVAADTKATDPQVISVTKEDVTPEEGSLGLLRKIAHALGLSSLASMSVLPGDGKLTLPGAETRGTEDPYGGLMGGGDTRFDGPLPGAIPLLEEPIPSIGNDAAPLESTGLFSMTSAFSLIKSLSGPADWPMPKVVLVRVRDFIGNPLANSTLDFFQSAGGKIAGPTPTFSLTSNSNGVAQLPTRDGIGPFGKLDDRAENGLFLVRLQKNGVTEFAWLKAWQLVDSVARGNGIATVVDLAFNVPVGVLESQTNRAADRIVSDSTGQAAATLAALVDGNLKSSASLGEKPGDWVEIDLGRDRTIGEIKIAAQADQFWNGFDVVLYGTGQKPEDGLVYARERNWGYARRNRSDGTFVAYRGIPIQVRYIRLVSRSGGPAKVEEIWATPATLTN